MSGLRAAAGFWWWKRKRVAATPLVIFGSKLKLWVRSDTIAPGIGARVATMLDKSGNGNDLAQGAMAQQPTKVANVLDGRDGIRFAGAAAPQWITKASGFTGFGAGDQPQQWIVAKFTGNADYVCSMHSPASYWFLIQESQTHFDCSWASGGNSRLSYTDPNTSLYRLVHTYMSPNQRIDRNGVNVANKPAVAGGTLPDAAASATIGNHNPSSQLYPMTGDLLEAVFVNNPPSADEKTALFTYFKARYPTIGITV